MAIKKEDKVLDPNDKARWGFTAGADGQIVVGSETVGETGGVEIIRSEPKEEEAQKNGGGKRGSKASTTQE